MKKIVITFGLISGVIAAALMWLLVTLLLSKALDFDNGEIFGYATMIVALSMVFFGVKSYRDNNGGHIGFWKAVQVGVLISLVSAVCYAASWELYYPTKGGEFLQQYTSHYIEKMKQEGTPPEEIEATSKEMDGFVEMYKNPVIRIAMTLMEILPVGIIVSFICAALLRRKELLPA